MDNILQRLGSINAAQAYSGLEPLGQRVEQEDPEVLEKRRLQFIELEKKSARRGEAMMIVTLAEKLFLLPSCELTFDRCLIQAEEAVKLAKEFLEARENFE